MKESAARLRTHSQAQAKDNLKRFIEVQKQAHAAGAPNWSAEGWLWRGSASRRGLRNVWFDTLPGCRGSAPFGGDFFDLVRALVAKAISDRAGQIDVSQLKRIVTACGALWSGAGCLTDATALTAAHFATAESEIKAKYSGDTVSGTLNRLQWVANTLDRQGISATLLQWRASKKCSGSRAGRRAKVGSEFEDERERKLPATGVIEALGELSGRKDLSDSDRVLSCAANLLVTCGFRATEVLGLPRDTIVRTPVLDADGSPVLDENGEPEMDLGLRYWPAKGGHIAVQIKPVPAPYRSIVLHAVEQVLAMTAPYAERARFMRDNPGRVQFGAPWDAMPGDTLLRYGDVAEMLGNTSDDFDARHSSGRQWCERNHVKVTLVPTETMGVSSRRKSLKAVKKADVEKAVIEMSDHKTNILPEAVGEMFLDKALFVVPERFFVDRSSIVNGSARSVKYSQLQIWLTGRKNGMQMSVFERLDLRDAVGKPLSANSHQFRHHLDTLLAGGGLTEMERARFAGRANITHNSAYEHVPGRVRARRILEAINRGKAISPAVEHAKRMPDPIRREEFKEALFGQAAHLTELGLCTHDWASAPCPNHGSHTDCKDHWICKGDPSHRAEAERQLEGNRWLVEMARAERDDETYGADEWLEHTAKLCDRLEKIVSVHRSNMIPDGWLVQLNADGEVMDTLELEATLAAE